MFTGIVKDTGKVRSIEKQSDGVRVLISGSKILESAEIGESISINGACLTVERTETESAEFYIMDETLDKTWFSKLEKDTTVNIEPSLTPEDRMGGHIVQGHIEDFAEIESIEKGEESWKITFELPDKLSNYIVSKGFIAVEGISLTVTEVNENSFSVALIPETLDKTNLSEKTEKDFVNLETDVTARYVEKMVASK